MKRAIFLGVAGALLSSAAMASAQIKFMIGPDNQPSDSASAETMRLYGAMNQRLADSTSGTLSSCLKIYAAYQSCKASEAAQGCSKAPVCSVKGKLPEIGLSGIKLEFPGGGDLAFLIPSGVKPSGPDPGGTFQVRRVSGGVIAGSRTTFVAPEYPSVAKAGHLSGIVVLRALITKEGLVKDLEVLSDTDPIFIESAVDAVRRWHYRPYTLNGEPMTVDTTITVNFSLNNPNKNPSMPMGSSPNGQSQFPQLGPPH